VHIQLKDP